MSGAARPLIGINLDFEETPGPRSFVRSTYYDAVHAAGGLPVLLPPLGGDGAAHELLARVDALLLTGGDDLSPCRWGEELHPKAKLMAKRRESFDVALGLAALERRMPTLAICCGTQLVNVLRGGSLIQDIPSLVPDALPHGNCTQPPGAPPAPPAPEHPVQLAAGTRLREIVGLETIPVNTVHHQACGRMGEGLIVSARAPDGIVEAWEDPALPFLVGVQWHPERLVDRAPQLALFRALIAAARPKG